MVLVSVRQIDRWRGKGGGIWCGPEPGRGQEKDVGKCDEEDDKKSVHTITDAESWITLVEEMPIDRTFSDFDAKS